MASWLKVAEDLFEVVDRRAKLVASELSEEQSDSQSQASNVQGSSAEKTKPRTKAQKRLSSKKSPEPSDTGHKQTRSEVLQSDVTPDKEETFSSDNEGSSSANSMVQASPELYGNSEKDTPKVPSSEPLDIDLVKNGVNQEEVSSIARNAEASLSTSNGELLNENAPDVHVEHPPSSFAAKDIEVVSEDHLTDAGQDTKSQTADVPSKTEQEKSQHVVADSHVNSETQLGEDDVKIETPVNQKKPQEKNSGTPPKMIQDQLDEAQGLLKTTNSTGQSKEARLARVCAGLSSRLQEYKSENAQLEELLIAERELSKSYEARIKQLQQDLSVSKSEVTRIESNMVEALAAKNSEIEALVNSMDALKKQAALSEGNLASLQANMESIMRNRELTETRMMQALREELSSAERRAEEERAAHNATKMAAMEREVELEHRAVETSTALARIQRVADERTSKASELEQKLALLEVECASLNQELQDMEARARRGQKKAPEEANQMLQIQAWQEEVERARQGQRDAESKLSSLEAEVQKMRVEMAAMKRDAEHYSRQEHMELEKRYRELTDLLYYKQTQLEAMASEKAAAEFQLEKEIKRLQEAQVEVERSRVPRRASSSWEEDTEIKALEPLPVYHRQAAAASIQLQKAVKLLDSGAVRATRFLWRYPTARIILLCYLVFVHLFLMYLLHRLQEQADILATNELAKSMGLADSNLP
ncbi:golgin candidate 1-like isoform X1 [Hibiscus syriacus]|uniref:golgin candidate 1-like isoform X1 n=1 Tax=Hibiscus syriacus TaxID=106335 RepID=UPI0019218D32|nr:golgin candidate 1-like isoform X1 [Hibiscus syriacus]XP_039018280.1 golgin candidate 1-like isoform X1 [Hibiscus syriacus]XP_039018281.1 golgin candidate 1-like isoform X1 [Hibiscus syriacus]XP_039018282.1 golgin candidate 1-like isoform X1 [Hibiscus syriacus]